MSRSRINNCAELPKMIFFAYMKIKMIRSNRKSMSLTVLKTGELIVRMPFFVSEKEAVCFIEKNREWIQKQLKQNEALSSVPVLSEAEIKELKKKARRLISEKVRYYAPIAGVTYGKISIRSQKTRWGSCSANGNLSFNFLLVLAPEEVLESVVVHELCHRKVMNHSKAFYDEVYRCMPDYDLRHKWLKQHGRELMQRIP